MLFNETSLRKSFISLITLATLMGPTQGVCGVYDLNEGYQLVPGLRKFKKQSEYVLNTSFKPAESNLKTTPKIEPFPKDADHLIPMEHLLQSTEQEYIKSLYSQPHIIVQKIVPRLNAWTVAQLSVANRTIRRILYETSCFCNWSDCFGDSRVTFTGNVNCSWPIVRGRIISRKLIPILECPYPMHAYGVFEERFSAFIGQENGGLEVFRSIFYLTEGEIHPKSNVEQAFKQLTTIIENLGEERNAIITAAKPLFNERMNVYVIGNLLAAVKNLGKERNTIVTAAKPLINENMNGAEIQHLLWAVKSLG